jgi:D-glycero-alpha-D-manno-heptose-7-phosphate kinase
MTRTPLRVSFFGGGTDYPEYFATRPGAVIGMGINKYIYIAATILQAPIGYNYRVSYSKLETVEAITDIQHPVVRSVLADYHVRDHLDISVMSDLPSSGGGLGSSSAFTVGFVNLIRTMAGHELTKLDLATEAIRFEREVLQERVGVQDQLHASYGGFNRFDFDGKRIRISPVQVSAGVLSELNESMVLIHTGLGRRATDVVSEQIDATKSRKIDTELGHLYRLVDECEAALASRRSDIVSDLGQRLHESWLVKRSLSSKISNAHIDALYERAREGGAYGGKLCGAGGGGFLLALIPPSRIARLTEMVAPNAVLPIRMDYHGSTVIMSQPLSRTVSPTLSIRREKELVA